MNHDASLSSSKGKRKPVQREEAERQEAQRRVDATLARATACLMSDAKWRKLFAVLWEQKVGLLRWKFVHDSRVFVAGAPAPSALLEKRFADILPSPYGLFREIEWVEIPLEHTPRVTEALAAIGHFPLEPQASGVRVVGYHW